MLGNFTSNNSNWIGKENFAELVFVGISKSHKHSGSESGLSRNSRGKLWFTIWLKACPAKTKKKLLPLKKLCDFQRKRTKSRYQNLFRKTYVFRTLNCKKKKKCFAKIFAVNIFFSQRKKNSPWKYQSRCQSFLAFSYEGRRGERDSAPSFKSKSEKTLRTRLWKYYFDLVPRRVIKF